MLKNAAICLAALAIGGCATIQLPQEKLENTSAGIRGAEELGADRVPTAKLYLQLAREQSEQAKKLAAANDDRAVLVLGRAEADAELSLGLAREASVHADAVKAADDLKVVQSRGTP